MFGAKLHRALGIALAFGMAIPVAAGCGGASESQAKPQTGGAQSKKKAAAGDPDEERKAFVNECTKSAGKDEDFGPYCACAYDSFTKAITKDEAENGPSDERMKELQVKTQQACGALMPEGASKQKFIATCTEGREAFGEFCGCVWGELRKDLSVQDINTGQGLQSPKMVAKQSEMSKTCGTKLPDGVVQKAFTDDCAKEEKPQFCDCAWKQIASTSSPAEIIVSGVSQMAQAKIESSCGKFKSKPASK